MDMPIDFEIKKKTETIVFSYHEIGATPLLFSIKENEFCSINKLSDDIDIFVEVCDDSLPRHEKQLETKKEYVINTNNSQHPPLTYKIILTDKKTGLSKACFYEIKPIGAASSNQYNEMLKRIAEFNEYQLFDDGVATYGGKVDNYFNGRRFFESVLKNIHDCYEMIMASLIRIDNNPIVNLEKRLLKNTKTASKETRRTIAKTLKKSGQNCNYSERLVINYDNDSNRYLLFILSFCKQQLICFLTKIEESIAANQAKIDEITLRSTNTTSEDAVELRNFSLNNLRSKIGIASDTNEQISRIISKIDKIMSDQRFNFERSKIRNRQFHLNKDYSLVEKCLFGPLTRSYIFSPFSLNSLSASAIKKTSRLYEIYCLISIFESLEKLGYICLSPLYEDCDDNLSGMCWSFKNDNNLIKLSYEIDAVDYVKDNEEGLHFLNEVDNISPDFCLVLIQNKKPTRLAIIDAKCRKQKEVKKGLANKLKSVRAYLSFRYMLKGESITKGKSVDELIYLCPSQDEGIYKNDTYGYSIYPMLMNGSEPVLFELLKGFIENI